MKICASILLLFLFCTISVDASGQVSAVLSPCPGFANDLTADKKNWQQRIQAQFTLLQSDLSREQKMACLITEGQIVRLPKRLQADDPLHSILFEHWDNGNWIPSSRDEFLYGANGLVSSHTRHRWDIDTQAYNILLFKKLFFYDAEGRIIATIWQIWDDTLQAFVSDFRSILEWSNAGEMIRSMGYRWQNDDWVLVTSFERTIENGVVTVELRKIHNDDSDMLANESQVLFEYDDQQRVSLRIVQNWDNDLSMWQNSSRETITYEGLTRTSQGDIYRDGAWQPWLEQVTIYNEQNQPLEEVNSLAGDTPQPLGRKFNTYNEQGFRTERLCQFFNTMKGMWQSNGRVVSTVDDDGDVLERLTQELDLIQQALVNVGRAVYRYAPAVSIEDGPQSNQISLTLYPNPTLSHVNLEISLDQPAELRIEIFDQLGRRITTLFDTPLATGLQRFVWKPNDVSAGIYFVRLQLDDKVKTLSVTLMK